MSSKPKGDCVFTGLIRHLGKVLSLTPQPGGRLIKITVLGAETPRWEMGESVAVNGACLTVVEAGRGIYAMDISEETLARTNLGLLKPGDMVNLEGSLRVGDSLDGHLVLGHVDTTVTFMGFRREGNFFTLKFSLPALYARYVAEKGSVALNGISLTVSSVAEGSFDVVVIPHTYENTNLSYLKPGDKINLEVDVVARYVERLLGSAKGGITQDKLKEAGFI